MGDELNPCISLKWFSSWLKHLFKMTVVPDQLRSRKKTIESSLWCKMEHTFSSRTTHVREHTCEAPGKFDIVTTRAIHPLRRSAAAAAHNPRLHNCGATCHPSSPNNWSMYRGHVICWVKDSVVGWLIRSRSNNSYWTNLPEQLVNWTKTTCPKC